jgi:hypothetical protein
MTDTKTDHPIIYLEPVCPNCDKGFYSEGRLWCQDDVWDGDVCEDCLEKMPPATVYEIKKDDP